MNEKLVSLWNLVEANLRLVTISVFITLLLIVMGLQATEKADSAEISIPTGAPPKDTKAILADPAAETIIGVLESSKTPITVTAFAPLISNSMFDVKAVLNAVALESQANQRFDEAYRLSNERKYREALEICKEVLTMRPGHLRAQELKNNLEETLKGAGVLRGKNGSSTALSPTPSPPGAAVPSSR